MKRATLSDELAELRRIARHYRPLSRLLRGTVEFLALMIFMGGLGAFALGAADPSPAAAPVMLVEAR
ncbi:hypothetical protein [Aureimonas sp. SK2]|uniref:hypothetical protein n=1 Tax=Aureimonas sp. SK2 TaxID=3015992 RepID=UPI0024447B9B|nr:hypothetical protein [Aureimonas sp. SK2]